MTAETYDNTTGKPMYSPATGKPSLGCGTTIYKLTPCLEVPDSPCVYVNGASKYTLTITDIVAAGCVGGGSCSYRICTSTPSTIGPVVLDAWYNTTYPTYCTISSTDPPALSTTIRIDVRLLSAGGCVGPVYSVEEATSSCCTIEWIDNGDGTVSPQVSITPNLTTYVYRLMLSGKTVTPSTAWNESITATTGTAFCDTEPDGRSIISGTISIVPGDRVTCNRGPGGAPVYSDDPALAPYVGKAIPLADGACWVWFAVTEVEALPEGEEAVEVDLSHLTGPTGDGVYDTCAEAVADTWEPS